MIELQADAQRLLLVLTLTLPRIMAVFTVLPFFAEAVLPGMIRNGIAISLAITVVPLVDSQVGTVPLVVSSLFFLIAKEAVVGLLIGYVVGTMFWAVASVGFFIDSQRGAMNASTFDPLVGDQTSPLGGFLTHTLVTLLLTSGGFLMFLDGFYQSYASWPVTSFYPTFTTATFEFFLKQLDLLMRLMVLLAGPAIIMMLLAEIGMALIGRFVPQINVFLLAMPIKSALALLLLVFYVSAMMHYAQTEMLHFERLFDSLRGLLG